MHRGRCGRPASAGDVLADPHGIWETEGGKSHVRRSDCENKPKRLCGTIIWMKNPRKDVKNDNERLRDRELVGTRVVWDLEHQGGKEWGAPGELWRGQPVKVR